MSEAVDLGELKRKSVRGGVVTMASQGLGIAIQLASTVVLGRLLSPEDYGIMAMVMAVTAFAGLFRDLGLSTAAIQRQELSPGQQSNLFWLNVALGALLTVALVAGAPLVAAFYGKPEVRDVTMLVATNFLIGSLGTQAGVTLLRKLAFGKKAAAEITGSLAGLAVSILLALRGGSYWSLAWGGVASAMVTTIALFFLSGFLPSLPRSGTGLREMLKFGASIATYNFINYFHRNLDNLLIGRFCGSEALGLYSRAYALLMLPISSLRMPITSVAFPALSRLQYEPEKFRAYYLRIVRIIALTSMPTAALLFIVNRPLVIIVLGQKWEGVCPIFEVLSSVAFVQPVITLWGLVVQSRGLGTRYVKMGAVSTLFTIIGFCVGLSWGPIGVATGYAIITYVTAIPLLMWAHKGTEIRIKEIIIEVVKPGTASIVAAWLSHLILFSAANKNQNYLENIMIKGISFSFIYALIIGISQNYKKEIAEIIKYLIKIKKTKLKK